jgi:diguanylate cyclase (GGDEF)-like protein
MGGSTHSAGLKRRESFGLGVAFILVLVLVGITAANAIFGIGGTAAQEPIRTWLSSAVYILVAMIVALRAVRGTTKQRSWALFALGLSLYGLGNVLWSFWIGNLRSPPFPSVCDVLWLTLYPLSYVGIVGFARERGQRSVPAGVWLDGIIAGAGLAALGAAFVFGPVVASATGSPTAVLTELAYPICDLLLAALMVGVLALAGWRIDRAWSLLSSGFLLLAVADCMYAVQVAHGSNNPSPMTNLFYVLAVALLAFAAWQPDRDIAPRLQGWSTLLIPAAFTLVALGLLVYDHVHRLQALAFGLASLTLLAAIVRMGLAFRDLHSLAEARTQAATDDLTSLPNRRLFMRRAGDALTAAELTAGGVSVLLLDLDNFKQLNDTLGHDAGDALLRLIGPRVKQVLRTTDTLARLGGDEFAILLYPHPDEEGIALVAEKVLGVLHQPFEVRGLALRITASVGIASFPAHAQDAEELMKHADIAMYQAKATRSGYEFYARDQDTNSQARLSLAADVATALDDGGIVVHFQPQAEAGSRQIIGMEALVRLRLPDGRLVLPSEFLLAAEQAGLSRALTRKVLGIGLDQLVVWRHAGHNLRLAVNTTVPDLLDSKFPLEVADALVTRGLPSDALTLEVTESSVLSDPKRIGNVLARLSELGIGISLDDFGTGYSSLTHLKALPVGELKLDRSFVAQMRTDPTDAAIVAATIELARKLGVRVVAEGVEDETTWKTLDTLGCDCIQGYHLSRPLPASEIDLLMSSTAVPHTNEPARSTTASDPIRSGSIH